MLLTNVTRVSFSNDNFFVAKKVRCLLTQLSLHINKWVYCFDDPLPFIFWSFTESINGLFVAIHWIIDNLESFLLVNVDILSANYVWGG